MSSKTKTELNSKLLAIKLSTQAWKFLYGKPTLLSSFNNFSPKKPNVNKTIRTSSITQIHSPEHTSVNEDFKKSRESERFNGRPKEFKCHQVQVSEPLLKEKLSSMLKRSNESSSVRDTLLKKEVNTKDLYELKQKQREFSQYTSNYDFCLPHIDSNSLLKKRYIRLITKKTLKEEFPSIKPIPITERNEKNGKFIKHKKSLTMKKTYIDNNDKNTVKKITVSKKMKRWLKHSDRESIKDKITDLCKKINQMLKTNMET